SDRVENAAGGPRPREPLLARAAVAEQALEYDPGMDLGEVRGRLVTPRHRVHVEAVARITLPLHRRIDAELDRRQRGVRADLAGRDLIGRRREPDLDARPRPVVRVHAGQPGGGGPRVIAGAVALRVCLA